MIGANPSPLAGHARSRPQRSSFSVFAAISTIEAPNAFPMPLRVAQVGFDRPRSMTPRVAVVMPAPWATASCVRPFFSRSWRIALPRAGWGLSEGAMGWTVSTSTS